MEPANSFMTWDSFVKCIVQMKTLSDVLHDGWEFHGNKNLENSAYISKRVYTRYQEVPHTELQQFEETNVYDESSSAGAYGDALLTVEYHVVFHPSYSCPCLCMNGWKMNGSMLSLEECWKHLGFSECDHKFNVLTQMDHPALMRPFLTLHPCKTGDLIATSFGNSKNSVVSWLSAVGPIVGLNISSEYAKLTF